MAKRKPHRKDINASRRRSRKAGLLLAAFVIVWGIAAEWYVHHPQQWLSDKHRTWPSALTSALYSFGNPLSDVTDALNITGSDTVYEYDTEAPVGSVTFAGLPRRTGLPAPADIRILNRGDFVIGWSDSLRHPVWVAYHVPKSAVYEVDRRPGFTKDAEVSSSPAPAEYTNSGYDRGHMAPNHAIVSRFGEVAQKLTFKMSNICPQKAALNRGVWRDFEHRITDFWTARYGEIWVVVGCISPEQGQLRIGRGIDVPKKFYQVVIAQEGMDVRALAIILNQDAHWRTYAARNIISIDELEKLTGLDFNPDLPEFIQSPLEAELPSRLWPIRLLDIFKFLLSSAKN